ncbi:MAG: hypothetical protein JWQ50_1716 [Caballeronia mineralivorans]|jgi:hypothetical protein|nr:hypothetical protein [Caballeronia mineralivorans]MEA3099527.1 hypothetical protein [Caballeronia mineralivorans]
MGYPAWKLSSNPSDIRQLIRYLREPFGLLGVCSGADDGDRHPELLAGGISRRPHCLQAERTHADRVVIDDCLKVERG